MYICLCHGVTDSAIRAAANDGVRTFTELSFKTGCGTQCGCCSTQARALLKECLEASPAESSAPKLKMILTS